MTYRDRTFCRGDGCAKFGACDRALTDAVRAAAERWHGGPNPPISEHENPKDHACYEAPKKAEDAK